MEIVLADVGNRPGQARALRGSGPGVVVAQHPSPLAEVLGHLSERAVVPLTGPRDPARSVCGGGHRARGSGQQPAHPDWTLPQLLG